MTEQEIKAEKDAALLVVKETATKAAEEAFKAKSAEFIGLELKSDESKALIKQIAQDVLNSLKIKEADGRETALPIIFDEVQKQFNELSIKVKAMQEKSTPAEGIFVKFVKDNIDSKKIEDRNYSSSLSFKVAALMTTANIIPNVAGGYSPLFGNYIDTEIGHVPKPENIILPLITVKNQPGTESIWFSDRINEDGDAEFIAEGALKPLADAEWKTTKAPIKEVAVRWKFTKRLMNHAPSVVADFLEHANELVEQKIDDAALEGVEDATNFNGLQAVAAAFVVPPQLAEFYTEANIFDVINAMASRIRLSNFRGKITAILNTVWEAKFMGYKDLEGRYLIPPFVTPDGKKVGSVSIAFSNKIDDDSILIGDLKKFNLVFAEQVTYDEGYENDDFSKNLVSRKLEAFLGTYIKLSDAGSILFDEISSVLTDISAIPTT